MRVASQQRFAAGGAAAGDRPGVAALELRQAGIQQRGVAQLGDGIEVLPVAGSEVLPDHALRVPVEVKGLEVIGAQLIADVRQHWLGAEGGSKAVGHIAGDAEGIGDVERAFFNAQHIELDRRRVVGLVLVYAIQISLQRFAGWGVHVHLRGVTVGVFADAQGAEQAVGVD